MCVCVRQKDIARPLLTVDSFTCARAGRFRLATGPSLIACISKYSVVKPKLACARACVRVLIFGAVHRATQCHRCCNGALETRASAHPFGHNLLFFIEKEIAMDRLACVRSLASVFVSVGASPLFVLCWDPLSFSLLLFSPSPVLKKHWPHWTRSFYSLTNTRQ